MVSSRLGEKKWTKQNTFSNKIKFILSPLSFFFFLDLVLLNVSPQTDSLLTQELRVSLSRLSEVMVC